MTERRRRAAASDPGGVERSPAAAGAPVRILHLEDSAADAELAAARLAGEGLECEITRTDGRAGFVAALARGGFDLVLADYSLPGFDGIAALALAREHAPGLPVILLSGTLGEETAVEALHRGAVDYLLKDRMTRLGSAVRRALREAEHHRNEQQLVHLANYDPLTGLFNRRRFAEELERQVVAARRTRAAGAVLCLDVDRFQDINDSFGHRAGDQVLVDVAGALQRSLRVTDVLARLGGDEFAVVLPAIERADALALARRLQAALRALRVEVDGGEIRLTASIGTAFFPAPGDTAQELLARADLALYRAKEDGRDAVRVLEAGEPWRAELQDRVDWARRLREALEGDDGFHFHAQPILDLRTGAIDRYELLLRMRGDDGAEVAPGLFLPVAQRFGMMREVDLWVARRAVRLLADLVRAGRRPVLQVNLSAHSLGDPGVLDRIAAELRADDLDPSLLVWEITESAAIADLHRASDFARGLRALGCRLALDDFGIGFASFAHLKHLPVDYLKIDGSFVRHLASEQVDRHLVQAIAALARALGKQTIAEFVEGAETLDLLAGFDIDYAQGYHIGRPGPLEQVLEISG